MNPNIRFEPVTTTESPLYERLEQLLVSSFPVEEYRDLREQREITNEETLFHVLAILSKKDGKEPCKENIRQEKGTEERRSQRDECFAGLLTYWQFDTFRYIEHFAVSSDLRNKGVGHKILSQFCLHTSAPIVLEAEPPTTSLACRRIAFYERNGFRTCPYSYLQPPYRPGEEYFPLILMAYGEVNWKKEFNSIRETIYRKVYHVKSESPD